MQTSKLHVPELQPSRRSDQRPSSTINYVDERWCCKSWISWSLRVPLLFTDKILRFQHVYRWMLPLWTSGRPWSVAWHKATGAHCPSHGLQQQLALPAHWSRNCLPREMKLPTIQSHIPRLAPLPPPSCARRKFTVLVRTWTLNVEFHLRTSRVIEAPSWCTTLALVR